MGLALEMRRICLGGEDDGTVEHRPTVDGGGHDQAPGKVGMDPVARRAATSRNRERTPPVTPSSWHCAEFSRERGARRCAVALARVGRRCRPGASPGARDCPLAMKHAAGWLGDGHAKLSTHTVRSCAKVVAMPPPGGCARSGGQWAGTHGPPRSVPARRVEEDNGTR